MASFNKGKVDPKKAPTKEEETYEKLQGKYENQDPLAQEKSLEEALNEKQEPLAQDKSFEEKFNEKQVPPAEGAAVDGEKVKTGVNEEPKKKDKHPFN